MQKSLQQAWYSRQKWVWCLAPFTFLFYLLSAFRRSLFKLGVMSSYRSSLPVVIVGNIGVGGNGKTPLVIALAEALTQQGFSIAVLSRGYGGEQTQFPYKVKESDSASLVGDEPLLIKRRLECELIIDPIRARGARFIEQHTNASLIICDDGLQHYALQRDCELCVIDHRKLGNGYLLPMGPLREGKWRLDSVNAIVNNLGFRNQSKHIGDKLAINDANEQALLDYNGDVPQTFMRLHANDWFNLKSGTKKSVGVFTEFLSQQDLSATKIIAIAGIGEPERFFSTVKALGIQAQSCLSFVDHHRFTATDIPQDAIVLMTEKDAVKCINFAHENCWYLQISASISGNLTDVVTQSLKRIEK